MQVLEARPTVVTRSQEFMTRVYGWMAAGLVLTGAVSYWTVHSGLFFKVHPFIMPLFFGLFALAWYLQSRVDRISPQGAAMGFIAYSALMGVCLSSIFVVYTEASLARVFFITAATFGGMGLYGMVTRSDLTSVGSTCIMGFWGIFVASLVNIFVQSDAWSWVISFIGVIVFTGLAAYENQRLVRLSQQIDAASRMGKSVAIIGALVLYITFINLFLSLLRLFGGRR